MPRLVTRTLSINNDTGDQSRAEPPTRQSDTQTACLLSVILPVYNEAPRIEQTFKAVSSFAGRHPDYEFIFSDDGSTDGSGQMLENLINDAENNITGRVRLIRHTHNHGKGYAVGSAVQRCQGDHIVFTDGDLAYSLDHLPAMLSQLKCNDVVIGSRHLAGDTVSLKRSLPRLVLGEGFNRLARVLFRLPYRDTQAGLKAFTRNAATAIFKRRRITRYAFDVEIIYLARRLNLRIGETAAHISPAHMNKGSSMNLVKDPLLMFFDLIRIHYYRITGRYD